ncbi:MFS transporter [Pseudonocardia sp. CA-142604]|uniref:MFS transporter n=1 Tax=Pseudonocardia sp. CA-142604 TaxID=3240024 RepID=UPI003D8F1A7E
MNVETAGNTASLRSATALLIAMCLGLMLSMFNSTLVNVTLPDIATSLRVSATELQWVSTIYSLCYAAMLLPGGALGNRLGRRNAFLAGIGVFVVGSLGCAAAPDLAALLAARVAQALGAATMLPQTLAILVHEFDHASVRSRAVGIWAGLASLGLAAGPVLGGAIVSISSWRWGFLLSVLLGAATLALALPAVPQSRHGRTPGAPTVDLPGAALSVVALAALVFGLIESTDLGWDSPFIVLAFIASALAIAGFLLLEHTLGRRGTHPIMPLDIWRSRHFVAANLAGLAYFFCFFGILYFFSIDLQQQRGFTPLITGIAFLPMMITIAVLGPVAGRLGARFGSTRVLTAGLLIGGVGCFLLAFPAHSDSLLGVESQLLIVGIGCGLMSSPTSNLAVSSVERRHSSTASAVHNMCRQIGATLGVAVLAGVVSASEFATGLDHAMAVLGALLAATAVAVWLLTRRTAR